MRHFRLRSSSTQLADFLREELRSGAWGKAMPGESWLVSNLRVGRNIVRAALKQLEKEGLLLSQGAGRPRLIERSKGALAANCRITLLLYSPSALHKEDTQRVLRRLSETGYQVQVARKTLTELGMNPARVAKMAEGVETDGWVVFAGSREVLEWFARQPTPAFALYGRFPEAPMASTGPGFFPAYQGAIQRLVELGHRRIVFLLPDAMRKPSPSKLLLTIIEELEALDIPVGDYTHPDWKQTPEGLQQCLDGLFRLTPPTALFIDQSREFHAVQRYLAGRGILAPSDISLICTEDDPDFEWMRPKVSHFEWSLRSCINRIVRWAGHVARGDEDRRRGLMAAKFIEAETIGPVPKAR